MSAEKTVKAKLRGGPMDGHMVQFPDRTTVDFLISDPDSRQKRFITVRYERTTEAGDLPVFQFVARSQQSKDYRYGDSPQLN